MRESMRGLIGLFIKRREFLNLAAGISNHAEAHSEALRKHNRAVLSPGDAGPPPVAGVSRIIDDRHRRTARKGHFPDLPSLLKSKPFSIG